MWDSSHTHTHHTINQIGVSQGGSGGAKQDKGLSKLGAKILSEKKKKKVREKLFVILVGRTSMLVH